MPAPTSYTAGQWAHLPSFHFGDSPDMSDRLLALVLAGTKRATCGELASLSPDIVPAPGEFWVVNDGAGRPGAVIETLSVEHRRFDEIDLDFALAEGEGDETVEDWRAQHWAFFERQGRFSPDMMLLCERFRLVEPCKAG